MFKYMCEYMGCLGCKYVCVYGLAASICVIVWSGCKYLCVRMVWLQVYICVCVVWLQVYV